MRKLYKKLIKVWQPEKARQAFFYGLPNAKGVAMKLAISKSPGFYVSVAIGLVLIMIVVKALPETWGVKKYFTVV